MFKRNNFCAIFIAICLVLSKALAQEEIPSDELTVKEYSPPSHAKPLTLIEALEQGLRSNYEQKIREFKFKALDLEYENQFHAFWFPSINLTLNSGDTLLQKLSTDNSDGPGTSRTPRGYVGIEFSDYTLFNWGRDYLLFLNQKESYLRNKKILNEERRRLRFNIIGQYFKLSMTKTILRSRAEILRHTSFIYKIAREKAALKKISSQELLQAKEEFLKAMGAHREYLYEVLKEEQILAKLINDDIRTSYQMRNELLYKTLNTSVDEAYSYAMKANPDLLQANLNLANADRSFQKTLKDNLPLPKISLRLGAYRHGFSQEGIEDTYSTSELFGNRNVELVASVNMSWAIWGPQGFFNSRTKESSYLTKRIAEVELMEVKRDLNVVVANLIRRIQFLERRVESSLDRLKNARQSFDRALDNYISSKTTFVDIKTVVDALADSEYEHEEAKLQHLLHKMELSELMGIENLPGYNFEKLVIE